MFVLKLQFLNTHVTTSYLLIWLLRCSKYCFSEENGVALHFKQLNDSTSLGLSDSVWFRDKCIWRALNVLNEQGQSAWRHGIDGWRPAFPCFSLKCFNSCSLRFDWKLHFLHNHLILGHLQLTNDAHVNTYLLLSICEVCCNKELPTYLALAWIVSAISVKECKKCSCQNKFLTACRYQPRVKWMLVSKRTSWNKI